jgi:spore maturation protein CgeB
MVRGRAREGVLYVGPDYHGSNGTCWRDAWSELGMTVHTVDAERLLPWPQTVRERVWAKVYRRPPARDVDRLNNDIVAALAEFRPDLTYFIQGRYVRAETAAVARQYGQVVLYCNDDMSSPANRTSTTGELIKAVDCITTTKSFNVDEFARAGARRVVYLPNAFDPRIHFPAKLAPEDRTRFGGDIVFIGTFRPERADFLGRVADAVGETAMSVWGGGWHKMSRPSFWPRRQSWARLRRSIRGRELWGQDMGKALQANKIALGLLYRANRDLHTSRSFEIPACGGFMLAERTVEHQEYFAEDREAVYFDTLDELVDKIRYYLHHDAARTRIAAAGYRRCVESGYRYVDRAHELWRLLRGARPA